MNPQTSYFTHWLAAAIGDTLIPVMLGVFVLAAVGKLIVYLVALKQSAFATAFEIRVYRHLQGQYPRLRQGPMGFHALVETLLDLTYHETYVMLHGRHRRRREDPFIYAMNRIFLVEHAAHQMIEDTTRQTRYLDRYSSAPEFAKITRYAMMANQYFNAALGFIRISGANRLFAALPALFIISGILGTFLGITFGLPILRDVDPTDAALAKLTLSRFLDHMTFAMDTSVTGILLSILFTLVNVAFSVQQKQLAAFERFTRSLDLIWHCAKGETAEAPPAGDVGRASDRGVSTARSRAVKRRKPEGPEAAGS